MGQESVINYRGKSLAPSDNPPVVSVCAGALSKMLYGLILAILSQ